MKFSLINVAFIVAGIIHSLPVLALLGADKIESLYELKVADPNLLVLLQHRAILFGLVAIILFSAVANPALQRLALLIGSISMLSFMLMVFANTHASAALLRVAWVDAFALALLWGAFVWQWMRS